MRRPPARVEQSRFYACSIPAAGFSIGRERARLTGRLRFSVFAANGVPVRRIDAVSLWVIDAQDIVYRLLGAVVGMQHMRGTDAVTLRFLHRGVLVGRGRLNNQLLTLWIEFTERAGRPATAEVIAARSDRRRPSSQGSNRGESPDCGRKDTT